MKKSPVLVLVLLIGVLLMSALPASAAQGATLDAINFNPTTCVLSVTFTVEDAGPYYVTIYDDGVLIVSAGGTFPAGSTQTALLTIGGPDGLDGVAIAVRESAASPDAYTFVNDQYWTDAEGIDCQYRGFTFAGTIAGAAGPAVALPGCDVLLPIPATAVGGTFIADAPVYWAPGKLTSPLVTIKAGNSARVIGLDATGQYYKIIWVCDFVWVPVGTLGPNYDAVWNGAPLPTAVVK